MATKAHPSLSPSLTKHRTFFPWLLFVALAPQAAFFWLFWSFSFTSPPILDKAAQVPFLPASQPTSPLLKDELHLAGSGSCLPLLKWLQPHSSIQSILHPSIGSTGGMRALQDHAIHIALLSRFPKPREKIKGVQVLYYADVPVIFAVHPSVPLRDLTPQHMMDIYQGKLRRWSNGLPVVVFQRERGDSGHHAIYQHFPAFQHINEQAYLHQRWRVLYHDHEMQKMLLQTPGSIGIFDLGALRIQNLALRALSFRGVIPSLDHLAQKRYPFSKPLLLAFQNSSPTFLQKFLHDISKPQLRPLLRAYGYLRREGYR